MTEFPPSLPPFTLSHTLLTCAEPHHECDGEGVGGCEIVQQKVPVSWDHICEDYYHDFLAERADLKGNRRREMEGRREREGKREERKEGDERKGGDERNGGKEGKEVEEGEERRERRGE